MKSLLVAYLALSAATMIRTEGNDPPAKQAACPKKINDDLRKELLRRSKEDQDARPQVLDLMSRRKIVDPAEAKKLDAPETKKLRDTDRKNTTRMKEIVAKYGWPGKSLVGSDGANAAWLLVQHADHDRPFQKRCVELMRQAFKKGEVSGQDLAYLTDRVLVGENKKQLYGTQFQERDGKLIPQPIEDEAHVDKRRKELGLSSMAEYQKLMEEFYQSTGKAKK